MPFWSPWLKSKQASQLARVTSHENQKLSLKEANAASHRQTQLTLPFFRLFSVLLNSSTWGLLKGIEQPGIENPGISTVPFGSARCELVAGSCRQTTLPRGPLRGLKNPPTCPFEHTPTPFEEFFRDLLKTVCWMVWPHSLVPVGRRQLTVQPGLKLSDVLLGVRVLLPSPETRATYQPVCESWVSITHSLNIWVNYNDLT